MLGGFCLPFLRGIGLVNAKTNPKRRFNASRLAPTRRRAWRGVAQFRFSTAKTGGNWRTEQREAVLWCEGGTCMQDDPVLGIVLCISEGVALLICTISRIRKRLAVSATHSVP